LTYHARHPDNAIAEIHLALLKDPMESVKTAPCAFPLASSLLAEGAGAFDLVWLEVFLWSEELEAYVARQVGVLNEQSGDAIGVRCPWGIRFELEERCSLLFQER
jgi:hypothetical protein